MGVSVNRVGTAAERSALVAQILTVQKRLMNTQIQVSSEKKSLDYAGIEYDSFRLVNLENEATRLDRYSATNSVQASRLATMSTVLQSVDDTVRDFRSELSAYYLDDPNVEDEGQIEAIQTRALEALKSMEYYLNTSHDGRFLFAGGRTDTAPVSVPYTTLDDFQSVYDGSTVTFPQSRAAHVNDSKVVGDLDFNPAGTITAGSNLFVEQSINQAAGGDLTLNAASNTITAATGGAFSNVSNGDVIRLESTPPGPNDGFYTVKTVDGTGTVLTLESSPVVTDEVINSGTTPYTVTVPSIAPGPITVSDAGANSQTYTVTDISADGQTLTVTPPPNLTQSTSGVTVAPESYYKGDELSYEHRISDYRTIEVGVNAKDPAFEKAMRAMGIIAQGDLTNNPERVAEALELLSDSLDHDTLVTDEMTSDLTRVAKTIGLNEATVDKALDEQRDYLSFVQTRITDLENVDMTEALVRLADDAQSLETSYTTFSRISQLTLNDYI